MAKTVMISALISQSEQQVFKRRWFSVVAEADLQHRGPRWPHNEANPISVLITNDELMALMPLTCEPTPKST